MNKKRLFFDFLQKHNALEAYKNAFKTFNSRKLDSFEYSSLSVAFIWAYTSEGHEYWKELDEKWHCHFNSVKRKYHF
jgi:hypothetical protein